MVSNCMFCYEPCVIGQCFTVPKNMSPEAEAVWIQNLRIDRAWKYDIDKFCASHFDACVKYKAGNKTRLRRNAVPTIGVRYPGSSSTLPPAITYPVGRVAPVPAVKQPQSSREIQLLPSPVAGKQLQPRRAPLMEQNAPNVTIRRIDPAEDRHRCRNCPQSFEKLSALRIHILIYHKDRFFESADIVGDISYTIQHNRRTIDDIEDDQGDAAVQQYEEIEYVEDYYDGMAIAGDDNNQVEVFNASLADVEGEICDTDGTVQVDGGKRKIVSAAPDYRKNKRVKNRSNAAHECPHCGKKFTSKGSLKLHIARFHPANFKESLTCGSFINPTRGQCAMVLKSYGELVKHKKEDHPTVCPHVGCGEIFAYKYDLNEHVRIYHKLEVRLTDKEKQKKIEKYNLLNKAEFECIVNTSGVTQELLILYYDQLPSLFEVFPSDLKTAFRLQVGRTFDGFDATIASDDYFREFFFQFEAKIIEFCERHGITLDEFKDLFHLRVGGSCDIFARNKITFELLFDVIDKRISPKRNVTGEIGIIYLSVEQNVAIAVKETGSRHNFIAGGYSVQKDDSNVVEQQTENFFDNDERVTASGTQPVKGVYVVMYPKKYTNFLNLNAESQKFVPTHLRMKHDMAMEELKKKFTLKPLQPGETVRRFEGVEVDPYEEGEESEKMAEWVEKNIRHAQYSKPK